MHRLELTGIEKRFGDRTAVRSTNICLENGVYGLLGENGAGKTTLMRMICGILKPDKGNIRCDGMDIRRMGRSIAACWDICRRILDIMAIFPYGGSCITWPP